MPNSSSGRKGDELQQLAASVANAPAEVANRMIELIQ
jgi:hypothetical protein